MNRAPFIFAVTVILVAGISEGCASREGKGDSKRELISEAKPTIDTSRVLETLDLYRAKRFESVEDALSAGVENAHKLVLYGQKMEMLPETIGKLAYLQTLDIAYNELNELPDEISGLHYLQGFYANGNRLTRFPRQILLLPILRSVDLSENRITSIPVEIVRMDQLTRLSIDRNQLDAVPEELFELTRLEVLELAGNGLTEIPDGIGRLSALRKLDLSENRLPFIPAEIPTLSGHLAELMLQGNPIPREEIERLAQSMPGTTIRY